MGGARGRLGRVLRFWVLILLFWAMGFGEGGEVKGRLI